MRGHLPQDDTASSLGESAWFRARDHMAELEAYMDSLPRSALSFTKALGSAASLNFRDSTEPPTSPSETAYHELLSVLRREDRPLLGLVWHVAFGDANVAEAGLSGTSRAECILKLFEDL